MLYPFYRGGSDASGQQLVTAWACDLQEITVTLIADILGLMPLEFELTLAVVAGQLVFLELWNFPFLDDFHVPSLFAGATGKGIQWVGLA